MTQLPEDVLAKLNSVNAPQEANPIQVEFTPENQPAQKLTTYEPLFWKPTDPDYNPDFTPVENPTTFNTNQVELVPWGLPPDQSLEFKQAQYVEGLENFRPFDPPQFITKRDWFNFVVPVVNEFASDEEEEAYSEKRLVMVEWNNKGYGWEDAYFIAHGYNLIQPYEDYVMFAPMAVNECIGRVVHTSEDYLEFVNLMYRRDLFNAQDTTGKRGRPANPEARAKREQEKVQGRLAREQYQNACKAYNEERKAAWAEYQRLLQEQEKMRAYYALECNKAYTHYLTLKTVPKPRREDFK